MTDKIIISATAILVIGGLEAIALLKNIDGALFGLVIAAIAGIAGYQVKAKINSIPK